MKIWINNTSHRFSQLCWQVSTGPSQWHETITDERSLQKWQIWSCDTTTHTERKYIEDYWKIIVFTPSVYKDRIGFFRMAVKQWL